MGESRSMARKSVDIKSIIDKFKIDYQSVDLQSAYQRLRDKINLDDYFDYNRNNVDTGEQYTGLFHFVLNVRVLPEGGFIPFTYINHSDEDKEKEIYTWAADSFREGKIKYNFTDFLQDIVIKPITDKFPHSEFFFRTRYDDVSKRYLISNLEVIPQGVFYSKSLEVDNETIKNINDRLIGLKDNDFIQQISELYFRNTDGKPYYINNHKGEFIFAIYYFDSDYKTDLKLTNFLVIAERKEEIEYFVNHRIRKIRDLASLFRIRFTRDILQKQEIEAIKSAISAIMSRNMSHNLGSHYLYYTKASLEKLAANTRSNGPHIRGAAKVLSYIQGRMDYLATIVANDKYPYGSVNFKSQIWDELTIDDFSIRHYGNLPNDEFVNNLENSLIAISHVKSETERLNRLLNEIKNLDDDTAITEKRRKIERETAELYRQFKKIDQKNSYNRTTNYLLANLIRSENYSRPDVISKENEHRPLLLFVSLWDKSTNKFDLFKGDNDPVSMEREKKLKDKLSKINLALPGGTMSCHAFYNVLENFIRNSAKYSWTGANADKLIFTVALKVDDVEKVVQVTIYDNKHDALKPRDAKHTRSLLEDLTTKLRCHTKILDANFSVNKANKGLKEMLFSAVWLKANESNQSFANIITMIENASPRRKINLIKKYAFEFICVDDQGFETSDSDVANLAIRFTIPLFTQVESLDAKRIKNLKELVKLHTDVAEITNSIVPFLKQLPRSFEQIFPRYYLEDNNVSPQGIVDKCPFLQVHTKEIATENECENLMAVYKLRKSILNNLFDVDSFKIKMGGFEEPGFSSDIMHSKQIYFSTHLSTQSSKNEIRDLAGRYAYVDTISGNNFTKTLEGLFSAGISTDGFYRSFSDLYLALKIKESALTRITIIDERLFNSIRWGVNLPKKEKTSNDSTKMDIRSTAIELSMKNIRILNFLEKSRPRQNESAAKIVNAFPYFYGNTFYPTGPLADSPNATHFLSIHLGLIEKMLKSQKMEKELGFMGQTPFSKNRINRLMKLIKETFGARDTHKIHISIHSGRGNFSQELEGPLKEYPFISLASLENAFNNSKFLLSQLFYNTIFIGKGEINH